MFETWFLENENYTEHPLLTSMPCLSLPPKTAAPPRFYKTRDKAQLNTNKEEQELKKSLQLSSNNKTKQQRFKVIPDVSCTRFPKYHSVTKSLSLILMPDVSCTRSQTKGRFIHESHI